MHEGNKVQVMKNEWTERASVEDRCKGHTDGTDLVYGLTDRRENFEIDTFDYNGYKLPKGKAIAHKWIAAEKSVCISLDMETGGENSGIIQLSAHIFRMVQHNSKLTSETERECFDEYVRPSIDAIWEKNIFEIHGLHRDYSRIKEADNIIAVSRRFCTYMKFDISRSFIQCLHVGYILSSNVRDSLAGDLSYNITSRSVSTRRYWHALITATLMKITS